MAGRVNSARQVGRITGWSLLPVFVLGMSILLCVLPLMSCGVVEWAYEQNAKSRLPPSGNAPASGLRIVFVCSEGTPTYRDHICVMRADGTRQTLLTQDEGRSPVWSPDGKQIAFESGSYDIMVMNSDGSKSRRVVHGVSPWWMADGKRISFVACGPCLHSTLISPEGEPKGEWHSWQVGHAPPNIQAPYGDWIAYRGWRLYFGQEGRRDERQTPRSGCGAVVAGR